MQLWPDTKVLGVGGSNLGSLRRLSCEDPQLLDFFSGVSSQGATDRERLWVADSQECRQFAVLHSSSNYFLHRIHFPTFPRSGDGTIRLLPDSSAAMDCWLDGVNFLAEDWAVIWQQARRESLASGDGWMFDLTRFVQYAEQKNLDPFLLLENIDPDIIRGVALSACSNHRRQHGELIPETVWSLLDCLVARADGILGMCFELQSDAQYSEEDIYYQLRRLRKVWHRYCFNLISRRRRLAA